MSSSPVRMLHESLLASAERLPHKRALVVEGNAHDYASLASDALRLANTLSAKGVSRGDRVVIYLDNTYECAVALYATVLAGGVFVVVNPQTKADKLTFILNDSEAVVLITDGHLEGNFLAAYANASTLRTVICSGTCPRAVHPDRSPIVPFRDAVKASPASRPPGSVIPLDLAALIYTSGSTGQPKGVMMTHQAMVFAAESLLQYLRLSEEHTILNLLPLAFDYGLYQLLMSVRAGATLVLERSFAYPARTLQRLREEHVTVFPGVPTIFSTLVAMHRRAPLVFPSVTRVTNTAAALPGEYHALLREIFPNSLIYRMYGLTECKRVCFLEPELLDQKPDSVGKAIPGTETLLLSPDGARVPPGQPGILHVRGPHVMKGYWKQPEASARMLRPGPLPGEFMLCTTDWFRTDADGCLYFLGRSDDIIKTRGEKVCPVEVENVLYSIRGVREAAVIGIPDPHLGQAIKAFVALEQGAALTEKDIQKLCLSRLESFMAPAVVEFRPELPKTSSGKISKKDLR